MSPKNKPKPAATGIDPGTAGAYPGADPTAPGGMSIAALRTELAEKHGTPMSETRTWGPKFGPYIEAVIAGRKDREQEAGTTSLRIARSTKQAEPEPEYRIAADIYDEDEDDFSDLDFEDEIEDEVSDDLFLENEALADAAPSVDPPHLFTRFDSPECVLGLKGHYCCDCEPDTYTPTSSDLAAMFDDEDDTGFEDEVEAMLSTPKEKPTPIFVGMPGTFDYIFDGHYGASPSGAERWAHCTASLEASRTFLETLTLNQQHAYAQSSTAARQGTTAHAVGEAELLLMLGRITQEEFDHTLMEMTLSPVEEEAYNEEMAEHLNEYVDYVRQLADVGRPLLIEERVRAKVWLTGLHDGEVHEIPGSGDCIAMPSAVTPKGGDAADMHTITVADLKYGNGIDVSVEANPQVRIYFLGALARYVENGGDLEDITTAEYVIVQPRLGGIKVWTESLDDVLTWRDEVLAPALTAALYGSDNLPGEGSTFNPSESACQWCPARGGCPALIEDRMAAGASMFDEVLEAEVSGNPIDATIMSNERLGEVLAQIQGAVDLHKDIKEEVQRRLHRGQHVPLHELVNYTPPRSYKEGAAEAIEAAVKDKTIPSIYKPPALMTPTQALTLLKEQTEAREWLEQQIDVHDVKPVVGPDAERRAARGDKRKSWNGRPPESMFADETDEHDTPAPTIEEMFPS